jgi:hypothetical protein
MAADRLVEVFIGDIQGEHYVVVRVLLKTDETACPGGGIDETQGEEAAV